VTTAKCKCGAYDDASLVSYLGVCRACAKVAMAQLAEAQAELHEDGITEPCGHARRWQAHRDGLDPQSATFCLFCELTAVRAANENLWLQCAALDAALTDRESSLAIRTRERDEALQQLAEARAAARWIYYEFNQLTDDGANIPLRWPWLEAAGGPDDRT